MTAATQKFASGDRVRRSVKFGATGGPGTVLVVSNTRKDNWTAQKVRVRWDRNSFIGWIDSRQLERLP